MKEAPMEMTTGLTMVASQSHRGLLVVSGGDAKAWLENLITNDIAPFSESEKIATHAALLSPQGKILFDLMIVDCGDHLLIESARAVLPQLGQRLALYKLRANVAIARRDDWTVNVGPLGALVNPGSNPIIAQDGRSDRLGARIYVQGALTEILGARDAYTRHRVALGIPEAGLDYDLGQAFPHEANYDLTHGVSFTKGCFIGQEVVARMQNKTVVRRRIVKVHGEGLVRGVEIKAGAAPIGSIGTVVDDVALALVRLDRVIEARAAGTPLMAGAVSVIVEQTALDAYEATVAQRPPVPDF
jgi:tRNA-modifying protein YgfZ